MTGRVKTLKTKFVPSGAIHFVKKAERAKPKLKAKDKTMEHHDLRQKLAKRFECKVSAPAGIHTTNRATYVNEYKQAEIKILTL